MRYSWDIAKNRSNLKKHGVAFSQAVKIFEGAVVERFDDRFSYDEERVYAIGVADGYKITVIYTDTEKDERRIISAWRSEPYERRLYTKEIAKRTGK